VSAPARAGLAFALAFLAAAAGAGATTLTGSRLALPAVTSPAGGLLAQRAIDREWGYSEDSVYKEVDIPGYKSEPGAMAMSALLPGTGQLYVGEGRGWAFLLVETAGWIGRQLARQDADNGAGDITAFVGSPYDSAAGWSLQRYEANGGGGDTQYLERLWAGDRNAYYRRIASDPTFTAGFSGADPAYSQAHYVGMIDGRDSKLHLAGQYEGLLWLNHIVAAFDALRAARSHNLPLRQQYQLRLGEKIRHGRPEFRAAVVRRF
jgi:hypothetical protein